MKPTLVVLAAGMGSRYGGLKQVDPVGPSGETVMDYSVFDAIRAGFGRVVFVIRHEFEAEFRERIGSRYAGVVEVEYAFQSMDDLPIGYRVPEERVKPWGTAHAIRAARGVVKGPFAAINADDFYGRDAFARLGEFLGRDELNVGVERYAMVGYRLEQTLSDHGSVARGICSVGGDNLLRGVVEMTRIERGGDGRIQNLEEGVEPVELAGSERVSMNLWGFGHGLFAALEERFPSWLEVNMPNPRAEWFIPFVIDDMINEGRAEVEVLPTESRWFGITYREDKPLVEKAIRELVARGEYPEALFDA